MPSPPNESPEPAETADAAAPKELPEEEVYESDVEPVVDEKPSAWNGRALVALLLGVAVLGPMVAFAGVQVIWPDSIHTVNVLEQSPLTFAQGADYAAAETQGYAANFTTYSAATSFSVTINGVAGGQLIIDDYVNITKGAATASYKVSIGSALSGSLSNPAALKIRLWTGATAPTADADAQVCSVLDLEANATTESTGACTADTKVQIIFDLPQGASGTSTVSIRPSSVT